jgi:hypothetical protein
VILWIGAAADAQMVKVAVKSGFGVLLGSLMYIIMNVSQLGHFGRALVVSVMEKSLDFMVLIQILTAVIAGQDMLAMWSVSNIVIGMMIVSVVCLVR